MLCLTIIQSNFFTDFSRPYQRKFSLFIKDKLGLMLLWFKDLINVTEKLQFIDPTFRQSCLVPSSGVIAVTRGPFICSRCFSDEA